MVWKYPNMHTMFRMEIAQKWMLSSSHRTFFCTKCCRENNREFEFEEKNNRML